jgi:hypothetical protein
LQLQKLKRKGIALIKKFLIKLAMIPTTLNQMKLSCDNSGAMG